MVPLETLRRFPCFAGVREKTLRAITMFCEEISLAADQTLFHERDDAESLYLLISGRVDILFVLANGERRIVDTVIGGDIVSWSAMVEPYRLTASCIAREDAEVVAVRGEPLRELCAADPILGHRLMHQVACEMSSRLRGARVQLAAIG